MSGRFQASGLAFLEDMKETNALISGILSMLHPEQFLLGMKAHDKLSDIPQLQEIMELWASSFTAFQVINNRTCPVHTDCGAPYGALDILTAIGDFKGGSIHTPNLPIDFEQPPGSVLALASRVVQHGVQAYEGNRIAFAWFMKDDVLSWANIAQIEWATVQRNWQLVE